MTNQTLANLNYRELAREALDGGFTIALDGTRPTSGYVVALPGRERRIAVPTDYEQRRWSRVERQIYNYVIDHGADLRGEGIGYTVNAHLGAWRDGDTVVLDVVQVIDDAARAVLIGHLRGQDAIYHLDTGKTITLRQDVVKPERRSAEADADARADLEHELRLDEERIADEMEAAKVRGITAPEF